MKRILQLSTYPISNPLHGGQIRVSEIRKFFENNGCDVLSLSLSEMSHQGYTDNDYLLSDSALNEKCSVIFCSDYATALLSKEGKYYDFIKNKTKDFNPDIIMLEQVWLWPAVKRMINEKLLKEDIKIVYSSQNIEYKTKESLLDSHNINGLDVENVIKSIKELEIELSISSDYVVTCTQIDAKEFKEMGAKNTIICNNGVREREINEEELKLVDDILWGRKFVLFVGSAYPPNALGFWKMMGKSIAWLPPDTVILAAGGVSKILENYIPEDAKLYDYVNMDRIKKLGFVSEELLAALVAKAAVIILPITVGGGSNLKTAEAIASNRPVVATTRACRGFDFVNQLSNFLITDNQEEYIKGISIFLNDCNLHPINISEKLLRESVYWEITLKSLEIIVNNNMDKR